MTLTTRFSLFFLFIFLFTGCATQPIQQSTPAINQTIEQRNAQLTQMNDWQLSGKIAFIQESERKSASIRWQHKHSNNSQKLDLNSYLGINVLHLESKDNIHTIEVDGEKYQSDNLDQLISSLTGLTFPTEALSYWLKGLAFNDGDKIIYHENSQLPLQLTSGYKNNNWQVSYADYQQVNNVQLARKFTIEQNGLLIKISVKKWAIDL